MLPVPVMNGVRYLDHKDCVALATHPEEGFHIAFEFGAHILAVEYLPQNYPAIDVMVYKRREDWIKSLSSVEWIVDELAAPRLSMCPGLSHQSWQPSSPTRKAGRGRKPSRLYSCGHEIYVLPDVCVILLPAGPTGGWLSQEESLGKNMTLVQPLKWWGGKHFLLRRIIGPYASSSTLRGPYAGGLAVLLEKDPFSRSLYWGEEGLRTGRQRGRQRHPPRTHQLLAGAATRGQLSAFQRQIEAIPFSQIEWEEAEDSTTSRSGISMSKPLWRFSFAVDKAGPVDSRILPPFPETAPGGR